MKKKNPHEKEVDLILDDIRDTLAPQKNPNCTFTTRRQDKRLQERLIDLSAREDPSQWGSLVYCREQDQSAVGWENIVPYAKYAEKRLVEKGPAKRSRFTNPVDNSTIVRHLQERIRSWANKKPGHCPYTKKSYQQNRVTQPIAASMSKVAGRCPPRYRDRGVKCAQCSAQVVSSADLPSLLPEQDHLVQENQSHQSDTKKPVDAISTANAAATLSEKFPVTWSILNQDDAAHLNLQYGIDANVTYVPARRPTSHITNYTASKQHEQQLRTAKHPSVRAGGVLHPARMPSYRNYRKQGTIQSRRAPHHNHHPDQTKDLTEDHEEDRGPPHHAPAPSFVRYRDKFKCSICIEGLQVAGKNQTEALGGGACCGVPHRAARPYYMSSNPVSGTHHPDIASEQQHWPPNIEYSASYSSTAPLVQKPAPRPAHGDPDSTANHLSAYKDKKAGIAAAAALTADAPVTTSLVRSTGSLVQSTPSLVHSGTGSQNLGGVETKRTRRGQQQLGERKRRPQQVVVNKGNILGLRQLSVRKPGSGGGSKGNRRRTKSPVDHTGISLKGVASEASSASRRSAGDSKRSSEGGNTPTLFDRYQASHSGRRRQKKMYGVSICDVYESKPEDVFSYGLFLATPLSSPPTKQKLNPLIGPVNPSNCSRDLEGH